MKEGKKTMSKEYIEREAAIRALQPTHAPAINEVLASVLRRVPAADVVEVVRCRDCVYWRGENDICKGICIDFSADGYCSEGKRKDGGQEDETHL